jgi:hypothetical protein
VALLVFIQKSSTKVDDFYHLNITNFEKIIFQSYFCEKLFLISVLVINFIIKLFF